MDIRDIISSGIIEAYVLGMASDDEVRELETLSAQYPEVAAAIADAQQSLEDYSLLHAMEPPAGLKEQIWSALEQGETNRIAFPEPDPEPVSNVRAFEPLQQAPVKRSYGLIAASLALLIGSVALNVMFWNKSEKTEQELTAVKGEQSKMQEANQKYEAQLASTNRNMQLIMDPAMKPVALAGVGTHTTNQAMIFWDTRSKEVYLALKNMPPPPSGKQYQLWAIVNGKPVDAGVFALDQKDAMQKMKVIPQAEMFAITLEKEGGSEAPTLEEMYVAGKV